MEELAIPKKSFKYEKVLISESKKIENEFKFNNPYRLKFKFLDNRVFQTAKSRKPLKKLKRTPHLAILDLKRYLYLQKTIQLKVSEGIRTTYLKYFKCLSNLKIHYIHKKTLSKPRIYGLKKILIKVTNSKLIFEKKASNLNIQKSDITITYNYKINKERRKTLSVDIYHLIINPYTSAFLLPSITIFSINSCMMKDGSQSQQLLLRQVIQNNPWIKTIKIPDLEMFYSNLAIFSPILERNKGKIEFNLSDHSSILRLIRQNFNFDYYLTVDEKYQMTLDSNLGNNISEVIRVKNLLQNFYFGQEMLDSKKHVYLNPKVCSSDILNFCYPFDSYSIVTDEFHSIPQTQITNMVQERKDYSKLFTLIHDFNNQNIETNDFLQFLANIKFTNIKDLRFFNLTFHNTNSEFAQLIIEYIRTNLKNLEILVLHLEFARTINPADYLSNIIKCATRCKLFEIKLSNSILIKFEILANGQKDLNISIYEDSDILHQIWPILREVFYDLYGLKLISNIGTPKIFKLISALIFGVKIQRLDLDFKKIDGLSGVHFNQLTYNLHHSKFIDEFFLSLNLKEDSQFKHSLINMHNLLFNNSEGCKLRSLFLRLSITNFNYDGLLTLKNVECKKR